MNQLILAHAGDTDGALFLLLFAPAGLMLLVGLLLVFLPLTSSPFDQPPPREEDLADRLLGEEEARRLRSQGRRRRGLRRRALRDHLAASRRASGD
jgi:hypothetical protein